MKDYTRRSVFQRYAVAVGAVMVMTALREILYPLTGTYSPLVTLYFAVMAAAWWGGMGPGLLAVALSVLAGLLFFIGAPWAFSNPQPYEWIRVVTFVIVNVLVCVMVEALHRARRNADARAGEAREKQSALEREIAGREQAESQLSHIFESVRDFAIIALDSEGRIRCWNAGAVAIFGYSADEVRDRPGELIFTLEDRARGIPEKELRTAREQGRSDDERWHLRKDGSRFYGSGSVSPMRDERGNLRGFTKVLRDATEPWKALRALRESEENFRAVFETAAAGVAQVELQTGRFLRVNRCFCDITGYSEAELLAMSFQDLTHPEEREANFEAAQCFARGEAKDYEAEKRYVRKDGRTIWVHVNAGIARDESGRPRYGVGVLLDITERKRATFALAEAEERFRLATEITGLGTWDADPETGEGHWSPRLCEIFGVPVSSNSKAKEGWALVHPEDRPELERRITAAKDPSGPGTFTSEHRLLRPGGDVRWVQARGLFLFAGEGVARRPVRGIGAVLDITERKDAEERLLRREEAMVTLATTRTNNMYERIRQVTETASRTLDVERIGVWLYTPEQAGIQCVDLYQRNTGTHESGRHLSANDYPSYFEALARGAPIMAEDALTHADTAEFKESYLVPLSISSMLDVPIWAGGKLAGVVCCEHTGPPRRWSSDDQEFAASLATTVALALEADYRKRAEEALAARERQLRRIGDNFPGLLYQVLVFPDGHWQVLYLSARLESLLGITVEEALHDAAVLWNAILPQERSKVLEAQTRSVRDMTPFDVTIQFRHQQTGEIRWGHLRSSPEWAPEGTVLFNGVGLDVTEQRRTEMALTEAEERLRLAAKAGGVGTFDTNLETNENHWSPEMRLIFGLPVDAPAPVGKDEIVSLVYPEDRERVSKELDLMMDPARARIIESTHRIQRPDGSVRWVHVSGMPVFSGRGPERRLVRVLGIAMDITPLKQAEEAARESSERFRTLADNISHLAWMADETGARFWFNRRWLEFTGAKEEEMRGWGWLKLVEPTYADRVASKFHRHVETGEVWEDTYPMQDRNGEYRWFLSRAVPIRDAQGKVLRWFGTNTDITEQRRREEEARDADRRKSEFLAMLGHELRNPLAAIRNALQLCEIESESFEWAKGVVDRQSAQLARLVDDLLDVSRIAQGKVTLRREPVDVCSAVWHAVEAVEPLIIQRGHQLSVECPSHELWVEADLGRLEQIVGNLLTNAAKYTEPGGRIEVSATCSAGVAQKQRAPEEGELAREVSITVRDTGVGIPSEKLPQMFDIFTQAERSLDRSEGGLGLGLALVKMLTEMHGGRVSAWSAGPGQGSAFTIHLPYLPAPASKRLGDTVATGRASAVPKGISSPSRAPGPFQERPSKGGGGGRILVVDDNADAAQALGRLLRRSGFEIEIALDGPSALEKAREFHPSVVLLDIGLPGMDGYEVARRLRAEERGSQPLLVAVTGYGQEEDRRRSREAGFDRHLVKPVEIGELRKILGKEPEPTTTVDTPSP